MKLKELICKDGSLLLDDYLVFFKYVKDNMEHPEWLGDFTKEELEGILSHGGKLWIYCNDIDIVCSVMYIPSRQKDLDRFNIGNYDYLEVGECGPIMVSPKYRGYGLQGQMLNMLDEYCRGINIIAILTTIHPDNFYCFNNFLRCNYIYSDVFMLKRGKRNLYIKHL